MPQQQPRPQQRGQEGFPAAAARPSFGVDESLAMLLTIVLWGDQFVWFLMESVQLRGPHEPTFLSISF